MTARDAWRHATAAARDRVVVLALVNTLQPVEYDALAENIGAVVDRRRLRAAVDSLRSQGMLARLPTREYVVSRRGRDALMAYGFRRTRDVNRMRYLFARSKGGGVTA